MSTKIYTGFRINTADFDKIRARVHAFRKPLLKLAERKLEHFLLHGDPKAQWRAWEERRRESDRTGQRDPAVDTRFEITFFPLERHCLGVTFHDNEDWHQLWLKQPGVQEYHYQNQTDRPDEISEAAWRRRERAWNTVFSVSDIPALAGFTIKALHSYEPYPYDVFARIRKKLAKEGNE